MICVFGIVSAVYLEYTLLIVFWISKIILSKIFDLQFAFYTLHLISIFY